MKTFIYFFFFSFILLISSSCQKENLDLHDQHNSKTLPSKSMYSSMELFGMAANFKSIKYNIDKKRYDIFFFNNPIKYSIHISTFDIDSLIKLRLEYSDKAVSSIVDIKDNRITIDNYIYFFDDLNNYEVSSSSDLFMRLTLGIIAHHENTPFRDIEYVNNGDNDVFPDIQEFKKCFWCKTTKTVVYSEYLNLCYDVVTTTIFWGLWEIESQSDIGICED